LIVNTTVLIDDKSERSGLCAEHGLSLWIEADDRKILFDTGQTDAFLRNAERLKIPVDQADCVVLSHGHYDHTGGIPAVSALIGKARLYLHPHALSPRYTRCKQAPHKAVGMPSSAAFRLLEAKTSIYWTNAPVLIARNIHMTGPIPRFHETEKNTGPYFLDSDCAMPDPITDDQALIIHSGKGWVVFLGCAHAGVVNTLDYVSRLTGASTIFAVIGGMHLRHADLTKLEATAEALSRHEVRLLAPCHCTGVDAIQFLQGRFHGKVVDCSAGKRLTIG
jgi:7,8-dihydropterin-6-yl-methyl-4-(beta-D-ribofuranosyl)aminobenzene 5'-phosphate synthase